MSYPPFQYEPFALLIPVVASKLQVTQVLDKSGIASFLLTFGITFACAGLYVVRIILQLTSFLKIKCFSIPYPPPK